MTSDLEPVARESAESIKRFLAVAALLGATTPLAGQTPGCSEPHYRWSEKTDASLASVTPKRAFISTILKTWTPLALTGQALYTCAPRSGRELETYSVTGWVRYLERSEEHTSELQSLAYLVCRLLLEKKKKRKQRPGLLATCTNFCLPD